MKAQALQLDSPIPLCTDCDEAVKSFDYDPINGDEIQQCDGCAEARYEKGIK